MEKKDDVRDKSVRITLRLSTQCNNDIVWLSKYFKITQKEVFNKIANMVSQEKEKDKLFLAFAEAIKSRSQSEKVRKAQVVSGNTYRLLNSLSRKYEVSRDEFIEALVDMYKTVLNFRSLRKEEIKKTKKAMEMIGALWHQAEEMEKQFTELFGAEHRITEGLGYIIVHIMNLSIGIENELKTGIPLDPTNPN